MKDESFLPSYMALGPKYTAFKIDCNIDCNIWAKAMQEGKDGRSYKSAPLRLGGAVFQLVDGLDGRVSGTRGMAGRGRRSFRVGFGLAGQRLSGRRVGVVVAVFSLVALPDSEGGEGEGWALRGILASGGEDTAAWKTSMNYSFARDT